MAMPSSGCIQLRCCYDSVACSSIGIAVCGSVQTPTSLCAISVAAGKTAPHAMSEFYGYTLTSIYINMTTSHCIGQLCPALPGSDCYCLTFSACLCKPANTGAGSIQLLCCGTQICCWSYPVPAVACNCSGTWGPIIFKAGATACLCTVNGATGGRASIAFATLTLNTGSYCLGTPSCVYV